MIADKTIDDYYRMYVKDMQNDIDYYQDKLNTVNDRLLEIHSTIIDLSDEINDKLSISIYDYPVEFIDKRYNEDRKFINYVNKINRQDWTEDERNLIRVLNRYVSYLETQHELESLIEAAKKRLVITPWDYKRIVRQFYMKVHKVILEGDGYKFEKGLGTFYAENQKLNKKQLEYQRIVDYNQTAINKEKLLDLGLKPYNEKDAKIAALKGKEYDGVKYVAYLDKIKSFIKLRVSACRIEGNTPVEFKYKRYVDRSLEELSIQEMANSYCDNVEDISQLPVSLKTKLKILLYKFPDRIVKFRQYEQPNELNFKYR